MYSQNKRPHHEVEPAAVPLLVSVPEAARLLGVGTSFGWTLVRNGDLPTVRLGRRVLIPRSALEQFAGKYELDGHKMA